MYFKGTDEWEPKSQSDYIVYDLTWILVTGCRDPILDICKMVHSYSVIFLNKTKCQSLMTNT